MRDNNRYLDNRYDDYEAMFTGSSRKERRKRKPKANHQPKVSAEDIIEEIADPSSVEQGFKTTYQPSLYEQGWLLESLGSFFSLDYITDVMAQVKGGKEASVYRCTAHHSVGSEYVAAKVYRPRMFRQLRNDKMYREGRNMLNADGKELKPHEQRVMRAVDRKSSYGALVQHTSWLMHEFKTMEKLYRLGAAVPQPIVSSENAILMAYIGDERLAAPILNSVSLDTKEASRLFDELMRNLELMLRENIVHGDLSAYNILYWEGEITLIDFPQVVHVLNNPNAHDILLRDITRVCEYFARNGVERNPNEIMRHLWSRYVGYDAIGKAADFSRFEPEEPED